eukprot:6081402-Ditylum_brightwellii.AAC.1
MKPQSVDKVQGQIFIMSNIESDSELKYKIFHHLFAVQDHITAPPPKEQYHDYKVDSLLRWMRHRWKKAWFLGPHFSTDKQTAGMQ